MPAPTKVAGQVSDRARPREYTVRGDAGKGLRAKLMACHSHYRSAKVSIERTERSESGPPKGRRAVMAWHAVEVIREHRTEDGFHVSDRRCSVRRQSRNDLLPRFRCPEEAGRGDVLCGRRSRLTRSTIERRERLSMVRTTRRNLRNCRYEIGF
jgi:hypothetical protein